MLLGLAAALPTCVALTAELVFICARGKGLFLRPGGVGFVLRRTQRAVERKIRWLSGFATLASAGLAVAAGPMTRAGCLALGAVLALGAHLAFYSQVARRFQEETTCLERRSASGVDLEALQVRWDGVMTTRASFLAAALVCIVGSMMLR